MEDLRPQTIQIFLPDGNPRSVKLAEITSRTIQIVMFPRSKFDLVCSREECKNVGIYFLAGSDDEFSNPLLYIGEAEDCLYRIKQHNKSKEFWTIGLVAISKTQYFTKSHVKYLEWLCFVSAKKADRYKLDNSTIPAKPYISESMKADLQDNFETIKILVSSLGFPLFDEIKRVNQQESIFIKGKDAYAEGTYNEDGIVVFKGSKCNLEETRTAGSWLRKRRQTLIDDGILVNHDNVYIFTKDHVFNAPSTAAGVILGRRANGWIEWKYRNGKTLDEVHRNYE